ncbi:uncharacterized protein ACA1_295450 [Acanthamoeba castellanii str. Neff]|uniref:Uncharacterized protein n=1 Tax=Acanthamoeba castellanii (strain ATCC 30010 / Neff) TaxID=1257118 RepID=L8HJS3_ACACF|nr:uncharacterized protein ACA1_295450 [Acanthamoeba castellanii str. Neff]ELR25460.1 hypothetical protein ACA1_295450 [Acanthamoeba castellanii str. Neff]
MSAGAVASSSSSAPASRQPAAATAAHYREVQLPDELASAVFPSSPAFMTDDERRAADQAERELYLDRLDRRLKGIARRREKDRRLASRLQFAGGGDAIGAMMAGKARSADQWAHVGLNRHWEEAEAEERMRDREREAGILAAFREEHAEAMKLASSSSSSASPLTAAADADDDVVPILRYWRYEEGTIGGGGGDEANDDDETGGHRVHHQTDETRDEGDDDDDEEDRAQQRVEGSVGNPLLWDDDGDDGGGREPGLTERRRKGTKKQQEEDGPWSAWLWSLFCFPAAVFDGSIFLFRATHLSLCLYGLLPAGHEHLPCASVFFLYFDFLNI